MEHLDDPSRIGELRNIISGKKTLRRFYKKGYDGYAKSLQSCPEGGVALELGSGGGFVKEVIPEIVTSDILPYEGIDTVVDARSLPFQSDSLKFIGMINVFHHISDVESFFRESARCMVPGGRIFIVDQHLGCFSRPIYRLHHEPCNPKASEWSFGSTGPLSGANGALAWMVFERDREKFCSRFPEFRILRYSPHTPLSYWLSGGMKRVRFFPDRGDHLLTLVDRILSRISSNMGSFVDIELELKHS